MMFNRSLAVLLGVILMVASSIGTQNAWSQTTSTAGAKIDPILVPFARGESNQKVTSIFIVLQNLSENLRAPTRYRHDEVVTYLRNASAATKAKYDAYLSKIPNLRENMRPHRFYVSTLTYSAVVTPEGLRIAAQGPGVVKIYGNRRMERDPSSRPSEMRIIREAQYPYDWLDTQRDQMEKAFPQVNGDGVLLGSVDTGVDATHPGLQGKIKLFYDGEKHAIGTPRDTDTHGTHTIGTMIGTGKDGAPLGMAPKAFMVAAAALSGYDVMLESMDFMLDPDKNPSTADYPRAVNNSWHAGGAPDMELFYRAVNAWEAAGILPIFSAGNAGPKDGTITRPKEHPAAFAVAATGENGKITNFSSRGPAVFNGQKVEKPNISAPGNNIISTMPGGKYAAMSGTSMAAPHVTGASALLYQINPKLTPVQVRTVFMQSATPVDENGNPASSRVWNKVYGLGKLNILNAVKMVQSMSSRMMGLETFMDQHLASPSSLTIDYLIAMDQRAEKIDDLFAYPAGEEGSTWVPAKELF